MNGECEVKLKTDELTTRLVLDEVGDEQSINPRDHISIDHVADYQRDIVEYLANGEDFNEVWRQTPQVVETDREGIYFLVSGYHTILALKGAIAYIDERQERELKDDIEGSVERDGLPMQKADTDRHFEWTSIDLDFEVVFEVMPTEDYNYLDSAKFYAAFSNVHGQPLKHGEKKRAVQNVLSTTNLIDDWNDDALRPYMTDRELAAKLSVSKGTVFRARQELKQALYATGDEVTESDETPTPEVEPTEYEKSEIVTSAEQVVDEVIESDIDISDAIADVDALDKFEADTDDDSKEFVIERQDDDIECVIAPQIATDLRSSLNQGNHVRVRDQFGIFSHAESEHEGIVVGAVERYFNAPRFNDQEFSTQREYEIQMGSVKCRADVVLIDSNGNLAVIAECKPGGHEGDGINQLKSYLCATDTRFGIFANSTNPTNWQFFENLRRNQFDKIACSKFEDGVVEGIATRKRLADEITELESTREQLKQEINRLNPRKSELETEVSELAESEHELRDFHERRKKTSTQLEALLADLKTSHPQ